MTKLVQQIIRKATRREDEPLNILTFPTHERYETGLAQTGHRFWGWQGPNIKTWNSKYAPVPKNYHVLNKDKGDGQLPAYVDIDLVLSQNKFGQYDVAKKIAFQLQCPLVTLEHTLPVSGWPKSMIVQARSMGGDINVFISDYSIEKWGWNKTDESVRVVKHGVDTELFSPSEFVERKDLVCSVVNDWPNRDWCCGFNLWKEITGWPQSTLPINVWGDSPGLSVSAPDVPSLVQEYRRSKIFLNTSLISPVPTVLLEAMSCGCAVVSTDTCMIPEFIEHGVNGFMGKTAGELRHYVDLLRNDDELAEKMGRAARETIVKHFSLPLFVDKWNDIFRSVTCNS